MQWHARLNPEKFCLTVALTAVFTGIGLVTRRESFGERFQLRLVGGDDFETEAGIAPSALLSMGVYRNEDFVNHAGVAPSFWNCENNACNTSSAWGPCYAPRGRVDWEREVERNRDKSSIYPPKSTRSRVSDSLEDLCRPGFLIIGAGKCGTSSLYHYITDHPRVLPAKKKQIHYFKYYPSYPLKWYYSYFPAATSFLASGALMTGEASPGYLPYPGVADLIKQRMPGSRIIAIGRNPLERAYSSYRYNYVTPTIGELSKGKYRDRILPNQPEEYYYKFLFSFEDMIRAELTNLKSCLAPGGAAETGARDTYSHLAWVKLEMNRRNSTAMPALLDLDGFCYGESVSPTVIRAQWANMIKQHPEKVITASNAHLKQSLLGRSLYALPLEWWYAVFPKEDIYFMCTEELSDLSGAPMSSVAEFLGLPQFNFSSVVQGGPYNVGEHRGYDEEVSWQDVESDSNRIAERSLPDELRREVLEFIKPFNERLFGLTGRRCKWD